MSGTDHDTAETLARYRALEQHCAQILEAAHVDDWPRVRRLGRRSKALIASLPAPAAQPMDEASRREKFRLLRSIVRIDAQIRHLAQPWTLRVDRMLAADDPDAGDSRRT